MWEYTIETRYANSGIVYTMNISYDSFIQKYKEKFSSCPKNTIWREPFHGEIEKIPLVENEDSVNTPHLRVKSKLASCAIYIPEIERKLIFFVSGDQNDVSVNFDGVCLKYKPNQKYPYKIGISDGSKLSFKSFLYLQKCFEHQVLDNICSFKKHAFRAFLEWYVDYFFHYQLYFWSVCFILYIIGFLMKFFKKYKFNRL